MDFREYAAKETSELTARLIEAAAASADQAAQHAGDQERKVSDGLRGELHAAVEAHTFASTQLTDVRAQLTDAHARLADAQANVDRLQGELHATTERVEAGGRQLEAASRQLDEARKAGERLEEARTDLTAARDEQARARQDAESELRKARETMDSLRADLASAMKTLEKAAAERLASEEAAAAAASHSQAAEAKLVAVTDLFKKGAARVKTLEQAQDEHKRQIHDLESQLQSTKSAPATADMSGAVLDELLAGFQALAGATTIADMLTTLVEQMAAEFPRVALFRVKKGHLQGEHQIGFDLKTDIGKLVLPLGMDSLPARAASSGQIESLKGKELKESRMPFGGTPTSALALPIVVEGDTLAIVYADDFGAASRQRGGDDVRVRYAAAMRHFAVAVLLRLGKELKVLAELQKYATSLLHELEQMYDADVEAGKSGGELQKRLSGNLDYARSIYGSRTALEGADAATLIEDELDTLIDARADTEFARDLAAAAGRAEASSRQRSAAEAS